MRDCDARRARRLGKREGRSACDERWTKKEEESECGERPWKLFISSVIGAWTFLTFFGRFVATFDSEDCIICA